MAPTSKRTRASGLKTTPTAQSVEKFLAGIEDEGRRADARAMCKLLARVTRKQPELWGSAIVGFGRRTLVYPNGRELDWMAIGFSPRKANTAVYLAGGKDEYLDLLGRLGKHGTGKGCVYIKRVSDIDLEVLAELVDRSMKLAQKK